jgi:hypothetical protein
MTYRTAPGIEAAVMQMAFDYAAYGQLHMVKRAGQVAHELSPAGVLGEDQERHSANMETYLNKLTAA